jgi:hypothetical protein
MSKNSDEQIEYIRDSELAVKLDALIDIGAEIISTEQLDSGNWEVHYKL